MLSKSLICTALRAWVNQRPGLEFGNYGDVSAYRSELRSITKSRADALQNWPTEYRRAVCAVLASVLWDWVREHAMPKAEMRHNSETGETLERYDGLRAGDWIRRFFVREFGRGIAQRWFS